MEQYGEKGSLMLLSFSKFINDWVTHYYNLDWNKSAMLPNLMEIAKVVMTPEEITALKNVIIKVISDHPFAVCKYS